MVSTPPPFTIEALDAEGTGTRVVFEWRDDRYGHTIYAVRLGEAVLLAESVEGDAVSAWPPSPPLQQLHKQPSDTGGEVLFATGMAGKSHWSGSVATSVDQRRTDITVEFACRHRTPPDWLGVTYHVADPFRSEEVLAGGAVLLRASDSHPDMRIEGNGTNTSVIQLLRNTIQIAATATPYVATATTSRWGYALRLIQSKRN